LVRQGSFAKELHFPVLKKMPRLHTNYAAAQLDGWKD
jgi:hypothetical protein